MNADFIIWCAQEHLKRRGRFAPPPWLTPGYHGKRNHGKRHSVNKLRSYRDRRRARLQKLSRQLTGQMRG